MAGQRSRLLTTAPLLAVLAAGVCSAAEPVGETLEFSETATSAARALRAARAAERAGDSAVAAAHYAAAAEAAPAIAARARRFEAAAWLAADRTENAERAARAGLAVPETPPFVEAALYEVLGSALRAAGDATGMRTAWREALQRGPAAGRAEPLRLALAESLLTAGETEAAILELRTLWIDAPASEAARTAGEHLVRLEKDLDRPLRHAADHRERADRLFSLQRSAEALAGYDAALAAGLTGEDRRHALGRRAHCLFRLRRYDEAEPAFAALGADPSARLWRARSMARRGAVEEAIVALTALGAEPHAATSAWARQLAGLLHAGRGRSAPARELFASVVDDASASDEIAAAALWQLGWTAWIAGDAREAQHRMAALAARQIDPVERLAGRYWEARARGGEEGAAALAAIAGDYPFTYYGWRAAQAGPVRASVAPPLPPGTPALADVDLLPPRILIAAGFVDDAQAELVQLDARARGLADRTALGQLHVAAGSWDGARGLIVRAYGERLARGPAPGQEAVWQLAWPDAYGEEIRAAMPADAKIDATLVAAVMREESRYRADAVSVTGALGLLQIMPDTGERLARELGMADFRPARLLEPGPNLRLGSYYLERLARRFEGRLPAVIASYNAGPAAVSEWLTAAPLPDDEWIEAIPYAETRAYVKQVLRSLHAYRVLYP